MKNLYAKERVTSVEIQMDGTLRKIRFIKPEVCITQWKDKQILSEAHDLLYSASRDSTSDSLIQFLGRCDKLMFAMWRRESLLRANNRAQSFVSKNARVWQRMNVTFTVLINLLIIIRCSISMADSTSVVLTNGIGIGFDWAGPDGVNRTRRDCTAYPEIFGLCCLHFLFAVMRLAHFVIDRIPELLRMQKKQFVQMHGTSKEWRISVALLRILFLRLESVSIWGYMVMSLLSVFYYSLRPLFYSFMLLVDVIKGNKLLVYVLQSISMSRGSLLQVTYIGRY